jgi:hypothetical protein
MNIVNPGKNIHIEKNENAETVEFSIHIVKPSLSISIKGNIVNMESDINGT